MASSNKTAFHARSISLPTRSNPLTLTVEEQLYRLRSSELSTSSSSLCQNLAGLMDLFESVEDFLQLPVTQDEKCIEGVLDGSLMLLDVCGSIRDVLLQMKQSVQDLQSSIRRRCGDLDLANEISAYMTSRKKVNKVIRKCLAGLKKMNKRNCDLSVLREVEATTFATFESLLSYLSEQKAISKQSSSLVSKLMGHKQNKVEPKSVQKSLEALEMSIQDLEDELESVFRCLIKHRVSLLKILNQ